MDTGWELQTFSFYVSVSSLYQLITLSISFDLFFFLSLALCLYIHKYISYIYISIYIIFIYFYHFFSFFSLFFLSFSSLLLVMFLFHFFFPYLPFSLFISLYPFSLSLTSLESLVTISCHLHRNTSYHLADCRLWKSSAGDVLFTSLHSMGGSVFYNRWFLSVCAGSIALSC